MDITQEKRTVKEFPDPDDFTIAFREAMKRLRKKQETEDTEEEIMSDPNPKMIDSPKIKEPGSMVEYGEQIKKAIDLLTVDMGLDQEQIGAFSIRTPDKKGDKNATR